MAVVGCAGTGLLYDAIPLDNPRRPTDDASANEKLSEEIFTEATRIDRYANIKVGTEPLCAARIAKRYGLIGGYRFVNTLDETLQALQHHAVMLGAVWFSSFDTPDTAGRVDISPEAQARGGHEYVVDEIDVASRMVGCSNSWGPSWGLSGRFYISWELLRYLIAQRGEVTALVPVLKK